MSPPPSPLLSDTQRKLVGFALGFAAFAAIGALAAGTVFVLGWLVSYFSGVLWPLATAGIVALVMRPAVDLIERRLNLRRLSAVIILFALFLLCLAGILALALPPLIAQILDFIDYLPTLWKTGLAYANQHYPEWISVVKKQLAHPAVSKAVDALGGEAQGMLVQIVPSLKAAGGGIAAFFGFATHLALIPIYLFFFMLSRGEPAGKLGDHLPFLKPGVRTDVVFLLNEFIGIVVSFFRGQVIIGLIMGALLAIGFSAIGLKFGLVLGLALGILNIVPYLGTIVGLSISVPLALFQTGGGWGLVALVLLVKIIVQNIEGWFLTPKIMGDRTGLHPITIMVAIFFWGTALDGLLGLVLAIPLTAFIVTAWRLVKHKYMG